MATRMATSTISYNTEEFLREKLEVWVKAHIIQAYMYIRHKGEDGDKDHIHVRIEPNKKIDTMNLSEELKEYTTTHPKPLGVRPWRPSKEEDWVLYAVHEPDYMRLKYPGDTKEKLPYKWQDIVASDGYDVETAYIRAKASLAHTSASLVRRIQGGEHPLALVAQGENVFTINAISKALYSGDYANLAAEYNRLKSEHQALLASACSLGLDVQRDDDGLPFLVPGDGHGLPRSD